MCQNLKEKQNLKKIRKGEETKNNIGKMLFRLYTHIHTSLLGHRTPNQSERRVGDKTGKT